MLQCHFVQNGLWSTMQVGIHLFYRHMLELTTWGWSMSTCLSVHMYLCVINNAMIDVLLCTLLSSSPQGGICCDARTCSFVLANASQLCSNQTECAYNQTCKYPFLTLWSVAIYRSSPHVVASQGITHHSLFIVR